MEITDQVAKKNFDYWQSKEGIVDSFEKEGELILDQLRKVKGAHTIAYRKANGTKVEKPLFSIFGLQGNGKFDRRKSAILSDSIRNGDGRHMKTARSLGLDQFVFSYVGTHLPYHREGDAPPVCPFGIFVNVLDFPESHGSPCDRSFASKTLERNEILNYFLTPNDLQHLLANRILSDEYFEGDFWRYYGDYKKWHDTNYSLDHWKRLAEYCFYQRVMPNDIVAILWPVWEETALENGEYLPDELFEKIDEFKNEFPSIQVILYRPYQREITAKNWSEINQRDWQFALVEASNLAQKYYSEFGVFPSDILQARAYFEHKNNGK